MRIFELKKQRMIIAFSTGIFCLIVLICLFSPDTFAATPEEIQGFTNGETIVYEGGTIFSDLPEGLEGVVPNGAYSEDTENDANEEPPLGENPEDELLGASLPGSANPDADLNDALSSNENENKNGGDRGDTVKNSENTDNSHSDSDGVKTESGSSGSDDDSAGSAGGSAGESAGLGSTGGVGGSGESTDSAGGSGTGSTGGESSSEE